jgi:hypothetical protein
MTCFFGTKSVDAGRKLHGRSLLSWPSSAFP